MNTAKMNFAQITADVLACVCEALEDIGTPVCVCEETIGQPVLDSCDCVCSNGAGKGQLNVYIDGQIYPSRASNFPAAALDVQAIDKGCGVPFIVAPLAVQISRCTDATFGELTALQLWHQDATVVRQAIGCCLADMLDDGDIKRFLMGPTAINAPSGNCAGSTLTAWVALGHCTCPATPEPS